MRWYRERKARAEAEYRPDIEYPVSLSIDGKLMYDDTTLPAKDF